MKNLTDELENFSIGVFTTLAKNPGKIANWLI